VLGAAAHGKVDDEALLRRGVRPGVPALYVSSFKGVRPPESIGLGATLGADKAAYRVRLVNPMGQPRESW